MNLKKWTALLLGVMFALAAFAGCATNEPADEPAPAQSAAPAESAAPAAPAQSEVPAEPVKDTLVFSINADIVSLDPAFARDTVSSLVLYQLYDGLVKNDPDEGIVPSLAESWTFSDDNSEITFKLRSDVKFHNGDTMTSEDVAYSLNRAIASTYLTSYTGMMERVDVVDDTTVKLVLKQAFGPVLECLSSPSLGIVSKSAAESLGEDGFKNAPVGTGAYKFVEYSSGEKVVLVRNEDYWRGVPRIKDLTFVIMTDKSTAAIALENGEVDVLYAPDLNDRDHLMSLENVSYLEDNASFYMWMINFNTEKGIFSNAKLREAISYAVNREELLLGALNGIGQTVEMPIVPSVFGFDPSFTFNEYDPEKAKALLAEAGYPDGFTVTMKLNQSSVYTRPAEIVQEQLRQIGITVEFELMERAAFLSDVTTDADYEVTLFMYTAGYADADYVLYGRLHSSNIGGTNYCRYNNPEVDTLLDQARASSDNAERMKLYYSISEYVRADIPFIPLYTSSCNIACNAALSGVRASANERHTVFDYSWGE